MDPEWTLEGIDVRQVLKETEARKREEEEAIRQQLERMHDEERKFKAEMARKVQEGMRDFDKQLEEERTKNEEELVKRLRLQNETLLREKEEAQQQRMEQLGMVDDEQRKAILEEHAADMERQRSAQDGELERQQEKFSRRLKQQQKIRRRRELKRAQDELLAQTEGEREKQRAERKGIERIRTEGTQRAEALFKQAA